jgi:predicted adenylyl cyclase CyaB
MEFTVRDHASTEEKILHAHSHEVEIKLRVNPETVEALKARLELFPHVLHVQRDLHFRIPGKVLRLREEMGTWRLTRKGELSVLPDGTRVRQEHEAEVPSEVIPLLAETFDWLGFPASVQVNKVREEYRIDEVNLCIDRVEGLEGVFVEIECVGAKDPGDRLDRVRQKMGLADSAVETRGYAELLAIAAMNPE